jgi:hypothetical protein
MPTGFPPLPVYPYGIDSDYTLYLVYNTSEAPLTSNNEPWAEEVPVKPRKPGQTEIWADNGFATISGEMFYYDAVEKDSNGYVKTLKRCVRNLGGVHTRFNLAGEMVRGFVMAEHHNQLVDAILNIENFVGENFTPIEETLDWRIRHLRQTPIIFDDFDCPDVSFTFNIIANDPAAGILANYFIQVTGTFTNFTLDFGDGTFTKSVASGEHRYAPNANVDPIITIGNDKCQIVQSPIERASTVTPQETPEETIIELPIPVCPEIGDIFIPPVSIPPNDVIIPPLVFPCVDVSPFPSTFFGPISIAVDFSPINIPSVINVNVPSIPNINVIVPSIPNISLVVPSIPNIQVDVPSIPNIQVDVPSIPNIKVDIPSIPNIQVDIPPIVVDIPSIPNIQVDIPPIPNIQVDIPPIPNIVVDIPPIPHIFVDVPPIPNIVVDVPPIDIPPIYVILPDIPPIYVIPPDIPPIYVIPPDIPPITVNFGPVPSFPAIPFGPAPTFPAITFGNPPCVPVCWGSPPTVPVNVTVTCNCACCPSSAAINFREPEFVDQFNPFVPNQNWTQPEEMEINYDFQGFPSVIVIEPPVLPDLKVVHEIPSQIELLTPDVMSIEYVGPPLPSQIQLLAPPEPLKLVLDGPSTIKLDVSDLPEAIQLLAPAEMPKLEIDASLLPSAIQVVGMPSVVELIHNLPSVMRLEMPENPTVQMLPPTEAIPISVMVTLAVDGVQQILEEQKQQIQCVAIVPCPVK